MKFKVGDQVIVKKYGEIGIIDQVFDYLSRPYFVTTPAFTGVYGEDELENLGSTTPYITATKILMDEMMEKQQLELYETYSKPRTQSILSCDCGGYKTYQTMSPEAHSTWCSTRKA